MTVLSIPDYIVIASTLCVSVAIGMYFRFTGGRQKTTLEFFMAGKDVTVLPITCSLVASLLSTTTLIGVPADVYMYGIKFILMLIMFPVSAFIVSQMMLPVYYDMEITTAYEYIERRFGKKLHVVTSFLYTIQTIFHMATCLYGPCIALNATTGLPAWGSILLLGVICMFYCSLGGMKAVLWTDVFQIILMATTTAVIAIKGTMEVSGVRETFDIAKDGGRLQLFEFNFSLEERYTFWNTIMWSLVMKTSIFGANQTEIQRILTARSSNYAKRSVNFAFLFMGIIMGFSFYNGLVLYALYHKCDPIYRYSDDSLSTTNQLIPYTIITLLHQYPGLSGLCISGILSASLSSVSSSVNSLSAVTMEDFIRPYFLVHKLPESWMALIAKLIAIGYGVLCILLSIMVGRFRSLMEVTFTLIGMISGPALGIFSLGIFTTTANEEGTIIGLVAGLLLSGWIGFGSFFSGVKIPQLIRSIEECPENMNTTSKGIFENTSSTRELFFHQNVINDNRNIFPLYRVSFTWIVVFSFCTVVIVGYISSAVIRISKKSSKNVPPECISPFLRKWYFPQENKIYSQVMQVLNVENLKDENILKKRMNQEMSYTEVPAC